MSARHVAHSLALELGWWDVDGMLDAMTCRQYLEWLEFYRVRSERLDRARDEARMPKMSGKYGADVAGQKRLRADLLKHFGEYEKQKKRGR